MVKKRGTRVSKKIFSITPEQKVNAVIKNFVSFLILFIVSFILYGVTSVGFWNDFFFLLVLIFGFLALAFLLVWMILKLIKKKG
jgi:hypothetical protein